MRVAGDAYRTFAWSKDGGNNFTPRSYGPMPDAFGSACEGSVISIGSQLVQRHIYSWPRSGRNYVSLSVSTDSGHSWTRRITLDYGSSAYSALSAVTLDDGSIGVAVLWEHNGADALQFAVVEK